MKITSCSAFLTLLPPRPTRALGKTTPRSRTAHLETNAAAEGPRPPSLRVLRYDGGRRRSRFLPGGPPPPPQLSPCPSAGRRRVLPQLHRLQPAQLRRIRGDSRLPVPEVSATALPPPSRPAGTPKRPAPPLATGASLSPPAGPSPAAGPHACRRCTATPRAPSDLPRRVPSAPPPSPLPGRPRLSAPSARRPREQAGRKFAKWRSGAGGGGLPPSPRSRGGSLRGVVRPPSAPPPTSAAGAHGAAPA